MVKVVAVSNAVKHYKDLLNLQLDMGIFERKLGTLTANVSNVGEILKMIEDAKRNKQNNGNTDKVAE
jgi:hypothetical protein